MQTHASAQAQIAEIVWKFTPATVQEAFQRGLQGDNALLLACLKFSTAFLSSATNQQNQASGIFVQDAGTDPQALRALGFPTTLEVIQQYAREVDGEEPVAKLEAKKELEAKKVSGE
jgi:hypothetical protein